MMLLFDEEEEEEEEEQDHDVTSLNQRPRLLPRACVIKAHHNDPALVRSLENRLE